MKKGYISKAKLGSGERFASGKSKVASQYIKKGYSEEKAEKIGAAVMAKQGDKKYGKNKMSKMATAGKK